jgi:hypothetical protein
MKILLAAAAVLALGIGCAQAQAPSNADMQAQQMCGNDVFRLCGDAVPDRGRIEACMRRKFKQVSSPCRSFMAHYGTQRHHRAARQSHKRHYRHSYRHHKYSYRHKR